MAALPWDAIFTIAVLVVVVVAMLRDWLRVEMAFLGGLGAVLFAGVITPEQAFAGFSNPAVLTVGSLFVVAAGVQRTGALSFLDRIIFSSNRSLYRVLPRLMAPTSVFSAFLNNTPIVAMLTPRVQEWAERHDVAASKLLIPLSYASIVGGTITLVGTSTNIVVAGLLIDADIPPLQMFDLAWVGIPITFVVLIYFAVGGHRLLPDHGSTQPTAQAAFRESLFEVEVAPDSRLIGETLEEAGLRALKDAYVVHVRRDGRLMPASPDVLLQGGDALTVSGKINMFYQLLQREGLRPPHQSVVENGEERLPVFEAVVAESAEFAGKTLKEVNFRERYGGVVLAIQRRDERLEGPLGRVPIKAGDLLIIEAREGFDDRWNANRSVFYLVAPRRAPRPRPTPGKAPLALAILAAMILAFATSVIPLVTAAFVAALLMMASGAITVGDARDSIDVPVLIVIASALGLGGALEVTGVAAAAAHGIVSVTAAGGLVFVLLGLYVVTNILTELITNNAAAALMVPIALATAVELGVDPIAFAVIVAIAASASFISPIGYQTNLMVMGPGGYRFVDYFKVGLPVTLLVMITTVAVVFFVWIM